VQQIVMNHQSNAIRATTQDGHNRVKLAAGSLSRRGRAEPSVVLTVEDTGEGIPDALVSRIFEPFFTTRSHAGGTGLGLAVVKAIVDAHGGTIAVATRAGHGTIFTVHFPSAAPNVAGGWVA